MEKAHSPVDAMDPGTRKRLEVDGTSNEHKRKGGIRETTRKVKEEERGEDNNNDRLTHRGSTQRPL
jgi:hypothetical protein